MKFETIPHSRPVPCWTSSIPGLWRTRESLLFRASYRGRARVSAFLVATAILTPSLGVGGPAVWAVAGASARVAGGVAAQEVRTSSGEGVRVSTAQGVRVPTAQEARASTSKEPGASTSQEAGASAAASSITEQDVLRKLRVIADDSMLGRNTPSEGLDKTALWIAGEFERYGLRPAGQDSDGFIQSYPIREMAVKLDSATLAFEDGTSLRMGEEMGLLFGQPQAEAASGETYLLSGTRGLSDALPPGSMNGRLLVVALPSRGRFAVSNQTLAAIMESGASRVVVVSGMGTRDWDRWMAQQPGELVSRAPTQSQATPDGPLLLEGERSTMASLLERQGLALDSLLDRAGEETRVHVLPDAAWTWTIPSRVLSEVWAPNVVGIVEGTDLKDEYVLFSAHFDHVGVRHRVEGGDSIFNGADDNASGTIGVVELAQAFATLSTPPRRSLLFLAVSGEEEGMWGSQHFTTHPPVPLSQIVAALNMDMIGRNWRDKIVAIGKEHSDLGESLARVEAAHPELRMTAIDDLWPEERFYFRSDHINFARNGVPILFFFNGTHEDYHKVSDEPDRIDAEKAARVIKLVFFLGLDVANADQRPQWNPESRERIVIGGGGPADSSPHPRPQRAP